eukprot:GHVQ01024654.1.p1 GENE.GHVQ01024654.1~~GHVQ01024654.1.p1  ORF type:complete len:411 (+),score=58.23 GHVQ01024654.1:201-1433(+)
MATARPLVSVYSCEKEGEIVDSIKMPNVFVAPIRPDIVRFVHTNMSKNRRQAYGVAANAGYQTSAESWGTGRAVSRIPRVPGGGTHRAGQAAFGNMCRGGGMFAPNKTWRRWHRKINVTQKRHAVVSAIAATAIPALVMARGHRVDEVPELPLVVSDDMQGIQKTRKARDMLKVLGCEEELQKVIDSKMIRPGKGKLRNRRYVKRRGPLVIYESDSGVCRAFRNIPGVELCHVSRLNLLTLAPGGTVGRLVVWSASAFKYLQNLYGSVNGSATSDMKVGYHLPRPMMLNADIARIINSDEIQSVAKPMLKAPPRATRQLNPLVNEQAMFRLNPAASRMKQNRKLSAIPGSRHHELVQRRKRKNIEERKENHKKSKLYFREIQKAFSDKKDLELEKKEAARQALLVIRDAQ